MALKICKRGHLTGNRECGTCGTGRTVPVKGRVNAPFYHFDTKIKRQITADLRALGHVTVADLRQQHFHPAVIEHRG